MSVAIKSSKSSQRRVRTGGSSSSAANAARSEEVSVSSASISALRFLIASLSERSQERSTGLCPMRAHATWSTQICSEASKLYCRTSMPLGVRTHNGWPRLDQWRISLEQRLSTAPQSDTYVPRTTSCYQCTALMCTSIDLQSKWTLILNGNIAPTCLNYL